MCGPRRAFTAQGRRLGRLAKGQQFGPLLFGLGGGVALGVGRIALLLGVGCAQAMRAEAGH